MAGKKLSRAEKKQRKKEKLANQSPVWRGIKLGLKVMMITLLGIAVILGFVFYFTYGRKLLQYKKDADRIIAESTEDTFHTQETSQAYDTYGNLISEIKGEKSSYYIRYDEIPGYAVNAMIAIEDKNFMKHKGVDLKAMIRAAWELVKHKGEITEGGSTITQQLCKNIFLTSEVKFERKFKEIFLALALERKYSKEQIMEFYLNNIYFGNGYYGLEAASQGYFSRTAAQLSLSEITFLCAIPNNPTLYDPLDNRKNTLARRDRILKQMYDDGYLTKGEYIDAIDEKIKLNEKSIKKKNYIETYLYFCATEALMEAQGFKLKYEFDSDAKREKYDKEYQEKYNECHQSLYSSGYQIYTSLDVKLQKKLQSAVNNVLVDFSEKDENGIYTLQGAATCIDNSTGKVVAIVGGRSQKSDFYTLNRAYQSFRQPGSTMKPLIVYTPAFEMGYSPDSVLVDEPIEDGPKNASGTYSGEITARNAIKYSKNTTAWKLLEEVGVDKGLSYLQEMEFSKICDGDYTLASALGGMTKGVSTVEMASAYSTIENDGIFRSPSCIVKILDSDGNVVYGAEEKGQRVYKQNACRMMTSTMVSVMTEPGATGVGCNLQGYTCAGKTGTTNDLKDGWFVGYTRYYSTAVWVGYDIPRELPSLAGNSYPGKIWQTFMQDLHDSKGLKNRVFPDYEDIEGINEKPIATETPKPSDTPAPIEPVTPEPTMTPEPEETDVPIDTGDPEDSFEDIGDGDDIGGDENPGGETPEDGSVTTPEDGEVVPPTQEPTGPDDGNTDVPVNNSDIDIVN